MPSSTGTFHFEQQSYILKRAGFAVLKDTILKESPINTTALKKTNTNLIEKANTPRSKNLVQPVK
jgi:hypothetical protein